MILSAKQAFARVLNSTSDISCSAMYEMTMCRIIVVIAEWPAGQCLLSYFVPANGMTCSRYFHVPCRKLGHVVFAAVTAIQHQE